MHCPARPTPRADREREAKTGASACADAAANARATQLAQLAGARRDCACCVTCSKSSAPPPLAVLVAHLGQPHLAAPHEVVARREVPVLDEQPQRARRRLGEVDREVKRLVPHWRRAARVRASRKLVERLSVWRPPDVESGRGSVEPFDAAARWRSGARTTGCEPRSERPSMTSSLASTVPSAGHQFTGTSFCSARPASKSSRKIHCVHLTYSGSVVESSPGPGRLGGKGRAYGRALSPGVERTRDAAPRGPSRSSAPGP